jgi:hypothetical protein
MMHEAGKGDDMRPTDHKKYGNGYDLIWGRKKDDAKAEDDEFERIQREQEQRVGNNQNDTHRPT